MQSNSSGFDEDVLQFLGADIVSPKDVADMSAADVAERVATTPVRFSIFLHAFYYILMFRSGSQSISRCVERQCIDRRSCYAMQ
jgi:hypothetical protein